MITRAHYGIGIEAGDAQLNVGFNQIGLSFWLDWGFALPLLAAVAMGYKNVVATPAQTDGNAKLVSAYMSCHICRLHNRCSHSDPIAYHMQYGITRTFFRKLQTGGWYRWGRYTSGIALHDTITNTTESETFEESFLL